MSRSKILGANADEAFRERFADEARRAASVLHPNVVTVFDEGRDGADAFMVMELVRGRTLRDVIVDRGPLRPHEAARLITQIAAALDAAHEAGVIHCDVKPANVIVDQQGTAKLTDFGIARAARGPREHELIGTARYIAPERIEGKAPTERSDVYSLGLVAYELLAGRPPNAEMDTEDLLRVRLDGRDAIAAIGARRHQRGDRGRHREGARSRSAGSVRERGGVRSRSAGRIAARRRDRRPATRGAAAAGRPPAGVPRRHDDRAHGHRRRARRDARDLRVLPGPHRRRPPNAGSVGVGRGASGAERRREERQ